MFTTSGAVVLWVIAGFIGGDYYGAKVFETEQECVEFKEEITKHPLPASLKPYVTDCLPVVVAGSGEMPESVEAP